MTSVGDRQIDLQGLLLIGAAIAYFVVFYGRSPERWIGLQVRLSWLLVPDVPLNEWVGGEWARVGFKDRVAVLLAATGILSMALALGVLLLDALGALTKLTRLESFVFATGIGLNVLSTLTLAAGMAGGIGSRTFFLAGAAVVCVLSIARRKAFAFLSRSAWPGEPGADSQSETFVSNRVGLLLAAPFTILILLGSLLPPWHFDAREYHSQVPKEWYQQGHATFMPHNVYGNMPLAAELPAVLGMHMMRGEEAWWWGAIVGKVIIGSFALLTAIAVYAFGKRFMSRASGVAASLVFISTPWIGFVSMAGLIEGASALYAMLTVYGLALWYTRPDESKHEALVLVGLTSGAAVAVKYPAVLFVAAPAGMFILGVMGSSRQFSVRGLTTLVLMFSLAGGLWLVKNAAYTGNPTYPLLFEWFGGESRTPAKHEQWMRAHRAPHGGLSATALRTSVETLAVDSRFATPILLPFAFAGLLARRHRRLTALLAVYLLLVFTAWWLLTHRVDRFLIPHLPIAALIAGAGITLSASRIWRSAVAVLLLAALLPNLLLMSSQSVGDNRFLVALEDLRQLGPEDILEYNRHIHPAHVWLNENVRPGYAAVMCGEAQVFNLRMPVFYNTCFDDCVLEAMLRDKSKAEQLAEFRRRKISHVMVYWRELDRYREPGNYGYSDYVTRSLVRDELTRRRQLFRPITLPIDPENCQLFEVAGWQDWE